MPGVYIANGAPAGAGATNEIVDAWTDGRLGLNHEVTLLSYSTDAGQACSAPAVISPPGDRAPYSAPGIAPDRSRVDAAYHPLPQPFTTTTRPPPLHPRAPLS